MNFTRVVAISLDMSGYNLFHRTALKVGSVASSRIQEHFPQVTGELIAVPDPKMVEFVPAQKKLLQMQRSQNMIDLCQPLRHPVIIGVFRAEGELLKEMFGSRDHWNGPVDKSSIGCDSTELPMTVCNQPER